MLYTWVKLIRGSLMHTLFSKNGISFSLQLIRRKI